MRRRLFGRLVGWVRSCVLCGLEGGLTEGYGGDGRYFGHADEGLVGNDGYLDG